MQGSIHSFLYSFIPAVSVLSGFHKKMPQIGWLNNIYLCYSIAVNIAARYINMKTLLNFSVFSIWNSTWTYFQALFKKNRLEELIPFPPDCQELQNQIWNMITTPMFSLLGGAFVLFSHSIVYILLFYWFQTVIRLL